MQRPSPWSQESVLQLIELYRREELLWEARHVHHFNKKNSMHWELLAKAW